MLRDVKETFFSGDPEYFEEKFQEFLGRFNLDTEDVKNLSIAALIAKMIRPADSEQTRNELELLLEMARNSGLAGRKVSSLDKTVRPSKNAEERISKTDFQAFHGRETR